MRRNLLHRAWSIMAMGALLPGGGVLAAGTVLHVDDDADAGGDGLTWSGAFRFLQDGLAVAASGGVSEIRVAQGIYRPDRSEDDPKGTGDRGATFALLTGVGLRGGYAGLGAPDPDARDVTANETILSGDLLGDDGPDFEGVEDNSEQVVTAVDVDASGVLDGFTITAGNAGGDGGGMRIEGGGPTLVQCAFVANGAAASGGAVDATVGSAPSFLLCDFDGNRAGQSGGALIGAAGTVLTMTACTFGGNTAGESGGAVAAALMTLADCSFERNVAGRDGGAVLSGGAAILRDCSFTANEARERGGGFLDAGGGSTVTGCTFHDNVAGWGGGIAGDDVYLLTASGCTFAGNTALADGGGIYVIDYVHLEVADCTFDGNAAGSYGGGVHGIIDSELTLRSCVFRDNTAGRSGGGVSARAGSGASVHACTLEANEAIAGGGVFLEASWGEFSQCAFRSNRATVGGGIWTFENFNLIRIADSTFVQNEARRSGGGIAYYWIKASGCFFAGNTAGAFGGAAKGLDGGFTNCLFSGNTAGSAGGAIRGGYVDAANCTFHRNEAIFGGAISAAIYGAHLVNCIVWASGATGALDGPFSAEFSDVEGGIAGEGNIDADPRFVDAAGADGVPGTEDDDLHLGPGSPCIDAGNNSGVPQGTTGDLDGNVRFRDDPETPDTGRGDPPLVDLGVYEFAPTCIGDLDGSGRVDVADLVAVLGAWGPCEGCPQDLNGDRTVDIGDLIELLSRWGPCP